jgi:hypothetical protein
LGHCRGWLLLAQVKQLRAPDFMSRAQVEIFSYAMSLPARLRFDVHSRRAGTGFMPRSIFALKLGWRQKRRLNSPSVLIVKPSSAQRLVDLP